MKQIELERLQEELGKPSVGELYKKGVVEGLDPAVGEGYTVYQGNPVGFCEDVLGAKLWSKQEELLEAVRDYEIVHVRSATGVGKTFALSHIAAWIYKSFPDAQVYTTTAPPEANLKRLLWAEIFTLAKDFPELFAEDDVLASMLITRHPKQFITGVTIPTSSSEEDIETKWSGKHSPVLAFLIDEGDGIPDPVFRGADGCMSGGVFVRQCVCYNPKKKSGEVYRREKEGRAYVMEMSALDHPNVTTGQNVIPGAVTQQSVIRRIHLWTEPKPIEKEIDSTCWMIPEFLIGIIGTMTDGSEIPPLMPGWRVVIDDQFWYKVLGQYPPGGIDQLIWDEWIDNAVSLWESMRAMNSGAVIPPQGVRPTMGFDVADLGPDHNALAFRYGIWWEPPELFKEVDPVRAAEKAADRCIEKNARLCRVDATGIGAGGPASMVKRGKELKKRIIAVRVMVAETARGYADEDADFAAFAQLRDEGYWSMRTAFRTGKVALPPETYNETCRRLHESLAAMTYEITGKNLIKVLTKRIIRKRLGYSPDEMEAFMLTYALENTWLGGIRKKSP
jgi:hypothetical protein